MLAQADLRQHCIGYFLAKQCLCALGWHCTSNFLVQCYLRFIWTILYRKKIFCNDVLILLGTTLHRLKPCAMLSLRFKTTMHRKKSSIIDIIFWDFLIVYQIFFSPQVKRSMIINNKHFIYELPHKLPNDLRFGY